MAEGNGIVPWKVSVRCWVTFSSIQYSTRSWLMMNLWQFSRGKLPQLHNVTGRIVIMMWQCVKMLCLTLCGCLFWMTLAVPWKHEYWASNFMACSVVCSVPCTAVGTEVWTALFETLMFPLSFCCVSCNNDNFHRRSQAQGQIIWSTPSTIWLVGVLSSPG